MKRTFQNAGLQSPAAPSPRHERAAGPRLPRAASACLPCAPQHLWCVVRVIKKKCDQKNAGKKKRIKENKRRKASACLPCAPQHLSCVVRVIFLFYFYFLYIFYSISGVWCVLLLVLAYTIAYRPCAPRLLTLCPAPTDPVQMTIKEKKKRK